MTHEKGVRRFLMPFPSLMLKCPNQICSYQDKLTILHQFKVITFAVFYRGQYQQWNNHCYYPMHQTHEVVGSYQWYNLHEHSSFAHIRLLRAVYSIQSKENCWGATPAHQWTTTSIMYVVVQIDKWSTRTISNLFGMSLNTSTTYLAMCHICTSQIIWFHFNQLCIYLFHWSQTTSAILSHVVIWM